MLSPKDGLHGARRRHPSQGVEADRCRDYRLAFVAPALLVLDELGFVPFEKAGGELLIDVMSARHERTATIITSNLALSEWNRVFGDDKPTAALLDRLAQHPEVCVTRDPGDRVVLPSKRKTQTGRCLIESAKLVGIGPHTYLATATNATLRSAAIPLLHQLA